MNQRFLDIATSMVEKGQAVTLEALARKAGVSRSTAHRRTGGLATLLKTLQAQGIDSESCSTRARLLDAARRVVATRGVVGVSVESIAAEADASPVTVYRLFGDRETLIREALADVFPTGAMAAFDQKDLPLDQALMRIATGVIRFAGTYPGLMALMLLPSSKDRAELMAVHQIQHDLRVRLIDLFERHETEGTLTAGDALSRAGAFSGLCLGASLLMHELRPLEDGDVVPRARKVVEKFFRGEGLNPD